MLEQVHKIKLVALLVVLEIDHDVVALGDALARQLRGLGVRKQDGVFHNVAVVGDHVKGDAVTRLVDNRDLVVARYAAVEDAKTIAPCAHFEERLVQPVHCDLITEKSVGVEDVEEQLAVFIPRLVADHEIDIVVAVAPIQAGAARQA